MVKNNIKKTLVCLSLAATLSANIIAIPISVVADETTISINSATEQPPLVVQPVDNLENSSSETQTPEDIVVPTPKWIPIGSSITFKDIIGRDKVKDKLMDIVSPIDELEIQTVGEKPSLIVLSGQKGNGKERFVKALAGEIGALIYTCEKPEEKLEQNINADNTNNTINASDTDWIDEFGKQVLETASSGQKVIIFIKDMSPYINDKSLSKSLFKKLQIVKKSGLPILVIGSYKINEYDENNDSNNLESLTEQAEDYRLTIEEIQVNSFNFQEFESFMSEFFWDNTAVKNMIETDVPDDYITIINKYIYESKSVQNTNVHDYIELIKKWKTATLRFWRSDRLHKITIKKITEFLDDIMLGKVYEDIQLDMNLENNKEKIKTAVHEIGHSLVMMSCNNWSLYKVSVLPRSYLGVNLFNTKNKSHTDNSSELNSQIMCILGGRAAEQIIFDDFGIGAFSDLLLANGIARIKFYALGMGISGQFLPVPDAKVEAALENYINERYKSTLNILEKLKPLIVELAEKLVNENELMGYEIQASYNDYIEKHPEIKSLIEVNTSNKIKSKWAIVRWFQS